MYVINDLSFDPNDPLFPLPAVPGASWGIQIFTTHNLYGLDPEHCEVRATDSGLSLACDGLSWGGQQRHSPGRVEVVVVVEEDGAVSWRIEAWHDEPLKTVKLLLRDLPDAALRQGWWTATSTAAGSALPPSLWSERPASAAVTYATSSIPMHWSYPHSWLTPWACAGEGSGAVCVSVRDPEVRAKQFYVHIPPYADGKPIVELVWEADARHWAGHVATPEMRLRVCPDAATIDADFSAHLAFLERFYGLDRWEERRDVPAWMRDIRLVLNLNGQHWTGRVFNTFDSMADALRVVTRHIPGERVLAYMPGWEGRYYWAYPFYRPGEDMGGDAAFRRLLATARELGVRVMPMFGANDANAQLYPDWERSAFRMRTDRHVNPVLRYPDWDSDRTGEDDQVFLNPGEPTFRAHLLGQIDAAVRAYDLDGVYLDTTGAWANDPRHNLYEGYHALVGDIRARHPELLIAGEGWYDALLGLFPVNMSWLGVDRAYRYPDILLRYARAFGHLADGAPGDGSTGVHEAGFMPPPPTATTRGHIPALNIVNDTIARYGDEVARICRAAAGSS